MRRSGENTTPVRRRINLRQSREKLAGLLAANFVDGVQLVTLGYRPEGTCPSRKMADIQLMNWLREARRTQNKQFHYIRATERDNTGSEYPVHRIVLPLSETPVGSLVALWGYGPATVETVSGDELGALAGRLMAQALKIGRDPVPFGRIWSPSKSLIRPEKKGSN